MKINSDGIKLIKEFESLHDGDLKMIGLQPKMCPAQVWTVGWGHALLDPVTRKFLKGAGDKDKAYAMYPGMTNDEAEILLKRDLEAYGRAVTNAIKTRLTENQFSALVSFTYNCGIGALQKSTLLKKVNISPADSSIRTEFLKWNKAGGIELRGLTRRRTAEADLYFKK
jgi:lysozyme